MSVTIRRAETHDLDALVPLFDAYRVFYQQASDPARARDFLAQRMARQESVVLLAQHDGDAIGFTQLFPTFSSVRTGPMWILNDLFVDARARRLGAGRSLLDAAADFARDSGAVLITLETATDNATARALYRAAGWHEDASQWYSRGLTDQAAGAKRQD
ncbi:GNAT family N-acetyltransferase [Agrilutibacter solisilvae]|uniref:GNAT family N-acetyltransferase n=1 Tax=Agrilutibacter solisilvae TaxID=2763317 RepID=A0A975ATH1_9GAMM|nr:GNAT family N-acetyltransferase [Lysobacter solisilvae]QSX79822.1 GNAT family N-acetyltransferase [Lysobacter solisilvae]